MQTPQRTLSRLKAQLLASPSQIDARAAAVRVVRARKRCSEEHARQWLKLLEGTDEMDTLIRRVLPEAEWSRIQPGRDLCGVLGFPFHHDFFENLEEMRDEGYRIEHSDIPIVALNPTVGGVYPDGQELVFHLASLLHRPEQTYTRQEQLSGDDHTWSHLQGRFRLPQSLRPTGWVQWPFFTWVFENQRNPIRHVPMAIRMIEYDTGSVFFDYNSEWGDTGIEWTRENVMWLREQYRLARRIKRNLTRLSEWLNAEPDPRVTTALRLYRKAQNLTRDEKRKIKPDASAGATGRALITVF